MDTLLVGSNAINNLTVSATLASGFVKAWQAFAFNTGYIERIIFLTDSPVNTATSVQIGIAPGSGEGSISIKEEVLHIGVFSLLGSVIPSNTWIEITLETPVKVTKGQQYYLQLLPIEGTLHIKEFGAGGQSTLISNTGSHTEINESIHYNASGGNGPAPFACFGEVIENFYGVPLLKDLQSAAAPKIHWLFNERGPAPNIFVVDDGKKPLVGTEAASLRSIGEPLMNRPGLNKNDCYTSVMGGYHMVGCKEESHYYFNTSYPTSLFVTGSPLTIEGITAAEPNGRAFILIRVQGAFEVVIEGKSIVFNVKTESGSINTLTAVNALAGYSQLIHCEYDWVNKIQRIIVDGVIVIARAIAGKLAGSSSENRFDVLRPVLEENVVEAIAQDLAIYAGPESALNAAQIAQHYASFRALLTDPGHVRI